MSEDSDHVSNNHTSAGGRGRGAGRGCVVLVRNLARVVLAVSVLIVLGLVCTMEFMRWTDFFEPRTAVILNTERWKPFLQDCTQVSNATQNMDDGSIVFLTHPEFEDWETYLGIVAEDATHAGWVKMPVGDARLADSRYAVRSRVIKILKKNFNSGDPVRNFFSLQLDPVYGSSRTREVVEITYLKRSEAVLFVSYDAYD
ncbi:MAG: hypothetical protein L3K26_17940 [Candidatus Hydrogenedentes bacterium]|nr:hypothetical protein [Candidatus Hydrogenedentota bacterium]